MVQRDSEATVTLLLTGGHTHTLQLKTQDPILQALLVTVGEKGQPGARPPHPFNIHIDGGRRSVFFSSLDLVGLLTDPPLVTGAQARPAAPPVEKSRYAVIENFLAP